MAIRTTASPLASSVVARSRKNSECRAGSVFIVRHDSVLRFAAPRRQAPLGTPLIQSVASVGHSGNRPVRSDEQNALKGGLSEELRADLQVGPEPTSLILDRNEEPAITLGGPTYTGARPAALDQRAGQFEQDGRIGVSIVHENEQSRC